MCRFSTRRGALCGAVLSLFLPACLLAQPFQLPTANRALFEPGGEERFFVGTAGRSWESGTFGSVRSNGRQLHEGLDIRCLQRDKRGEPTDPVMASAEGTVAYINRRPSLSNYGSYLVLRHRIEGLDVYTLYAHLHEVRADLHEGQGVKAGEVVGIMGRTSNTREPITKDRAHVHFEINLLVNERFAEWYRKNEPGERNDHGAFNGQNLRGLDPRLILLGQQRDGPHFSLLAFIKSQTELCRVQVRDTNFSWLRRYPQLIVRNPVAEREGVAGYELVLNFLGIPFQVIPRAASELLSKAPVYLVSVNAAEHRRNPSGKLLTNHGGRWALSRTGEKLISLIIY
jgi:murein DD-endopeptidase MepM/ murein hydrolase activator NlpD